MFDRFPGIGGRSSEGAARVGGVGPQPVRFKSLGVVSDAFPFSISTIVGGCFRVRRAIKVMVNAGASVDTVLGMKNDGQITGCRTQDLGFPTT